MSQSAYRAWMLGVLLLVTAFNVDVLSITAPAIQADLHLNDTQIGVLSGIAYAFFYAVMGLPLARWADRGNRVLVIASTTLLWGVAVALCATAGTFWELLLIRIVVGIGEAGSLPAAQSLICDEFAPRERPRAIAIFSLGSVVSVVFGYFAVGWADQLLGWRWTFVLSGAPGILLSWLVLTLREPRKIGAILHADASQRSPSDAAPGLIELGRTLTRNRTFLVLAACYAVTSFFGGGTGQWEPVFYMRSYHLTSGQVGTILTAIYAGAGLFGLYIGGTLAARANVNERLILRAIGVLFAMYGLLIVVSYLTYSLPVALVGETTSALTSYIAAAPLMAVMQELVAPRMRATAVAILYLLANLIGGGLGPLAVGAMSDQLKPWLGEESLRYALLALTPGYIAGGILAWAAARSVIEDIRRVQGAQRGEQLYPSLIAVGERRLV